jgi:hypothetical protein
MHHRHSRVRACLLFRAAQPRPGQKVVVPHWPCERICSRVALECESGCLSAPSRCSVPRRASLRGRILPLASPTMVLIMQSFKWGCSQLTQRFKGFPWCPPSWSLHVACCTRLSNPSTSSRARFTSAGLVVYWGWCTRRNTSVSRWVIACNAP